MRKRLPYRATEFLSMLRAEPSKVVINIRHLLEGDFGGHTEQEIKDWLSHTDKSARVSAFTAIAGIYDLHAHEAREAYLSLPPKQRAELDTSINEELRAARMARSALVPSETPKSYRLSH